MVEDVKDDNDRDEDDEDDDDDDDDDDKEDGAQGRPFRLIFFIGFPVFLPEKEEGFHCYGVNCSILGRICHFCDLLYTVPGFSVMLGVFWVWSMLEGENKRINRNYESIKISLGDFDLKI